MKNQSVPNTRWLRSIELLPVIGTLLILITGNVASAQEGAATETESESEILELSPFEVVTSQDVGYLAANSISGSRLNTNLGDLAIPVTPFTQEFLEDTATTSVEELANYMLSTKHDEAESLQLFIASPSRRFRIRGLPAFNSSVDFFQSDLRLDHYNTERIEHSRGPNSILFGLGSPGGVVNVSTKRSVLNSSFGSITLQGRSHNGFRAVLDVNQPILKDRLSVRVAGVTDDRDLWRHHEYDDQERLFVTTRLQIFPKTKLDLYWEGGDVNKSRIQPNVAHDYYTPWVNAGRQLSDTPNGAAEIVNLSNNNYLVIDTDTGIAMDWRRKTRSDRNRIENVNVLFQEFDILPKETVLYAGPAFPQKTNSSRTAAFLQHSFTPDLHLEVAWNKERSNHDTVVGRAYTNLAVDTNLTLPNGEPNPNAGRPYTEGFPGTSYSYKRRETVRASLAYELDAKGFGKHQLAFLTEFETRSRRAGQIKPLIVENPYNTSRPEHPANNVRWRTYLNFDGPAQDVRAGDWRSGPLTVENSFPFREGPLLTIVEAVSGRELGVRFLNNIAGSAEEHFDRESFMGVLQSRFFKERLITVVGYRYDQQDATFAPRAQRGEPFGDFTRGPYIVRPGTTVFPTEAKNLTYSALFRVTDWLSVTYNRAENTSLPTTGSLPTETGRAPNPKGRSDDFGGKINIGNRFYLTGVYFETSADKDFRNLPAARQPERDFNPIWEALHEAGIPGPGGGSALDELTLTNGFTFDSASNGYEVELVGNPTDNWSIFLNYSDFTTKQTNLGLEGRAYFDQFRDYWLQGDNGRVLIDATGGFADVADDGDDEIETVAEAVADIEERIFQTYILPDGERPRGQVERQFNLRTRYSFSEGALNGFFVGGGVRYKSGEVTSFQVVSETEKNVTFGSANTLVDALFGYKGEFKWSDRNIRWSIQVNVNNLFDETQILPMRVSPTTSQIFNYRLQAPREFILTGKLSF